MLVVHHDGFDGTAQKNAKHAKIDETRESPGARVRVFRFISRVSRSLLIFLNTGIQNLLHLKNLFNV
jgi:hypothetical protein